MSNVFPRHTKSALPRAVRGDGIYIFDQNDKAYLDGSGGAAVSCLGHNNPAVLDAIRGQIDKIAFAHTGFFTSEAAEDLAEGLAAFAPGDLDRVYLVSGGSEAVESALKLARQYHIENGEPKRHRFIARRQSYHGNTLGALATGGNQWRREPFSPLMIETSHISACYEYRGKETGESSFDYGQRIANELEAEILRLGPETIAAFVAEPVVGATAGVLPPVEGYFKRIREICDQYGVLLILDEVMCGMGRTGTLFACEQEGVTPDILTTAKGLGAGYQPIGAMLCTTRIYNAIRDGSGFFQHGHTYNGHPTACAAAGAVLRELTKGGIAARVAPMGAALDAQLRARFGDHPNVGDIRGRGLFRGIELVADRDSKRPFDPALGLHKALKKAAFEAGLVCYPMGGTIDGRQGDHILLAPPFIITETQITELCDKLETAMKEVL